MVFRWCCRHTSLSCAHSVTFIDTLGECATHIPEISFRCVVIFGFSWCVSVSFGNCVFFVLSFHMSVVRITQHIEASTQGQRMMLRRRRTNSMPKNSRDRIISRAHNRCLLRRHYSRTHLKCLIWWNATLNANIINGGDN